MDNQTVTKKFNELVERKTARAISAEIPGYVNVSDDANRDLSFDVVLGNNWSHKLFGGVFYRSKPKNPDLPHLSAVFVQSKDGNTDTESGNPGDLGGGETDLHLIYEGLSRVDVDGVMAGANTIRGSNTIFGVWHPELIKLRRQVKRNLYPAQIVVTASGKIDIENELMFNVPEIPVYILTTNSGAKNIHYSAKVPDHVMTISTGDSLDWRESLKMLKSFGIETISVVGGRTTVSELFDQGLISDLYLTTSAKVGGKPNTPFYVGKKGLPSGRCVLSSVGRGIEQGVIFQHFVYK